MFFKTDKSGHAVGKEYVKNDSLKNKSSDEIPVDIDSEKENSKKVLDLEDLNLLTFKNEQCQKEKCQCKLAGKRPNHSATDLFGPTKVAKLSEENVFKTQSDHKFFEKNFITHSLPPLSPKSLTENSFDLKELTLDFKSLVTNEKSLSSKGLFQFTGNGSRNIHLRKNRKTKAQNNLSSTKTSSPTFFCARVNSDDSDEELSEGFKKFNFSTKNQTKPPLSTAPTNSKSLTSNCSREALVRAEAGLTTSEDDWTMVELESYFEDLCHIPKKMSAMAMMMYT